MQEIKEKWGSDRWSGEASNSCNFPTVTWLAHFRISNIYFIWYKSRHLKRKQNGDLIHTQVYFEEVWWVCWKENEFWSQVVLGSNPISATFYPCDHGKLSSTLSPHLLSGNNAHFLGLLWNEKLMWIRCLSSA